MSGKKGISVSGDNPEANPEEDGTSEKHVMLSMTAEPEPEIKPKGKNVQLDLLGAKSPAADEEDEDPEAAKLLQDSAISAALAAGTPADPNLTAPEPRLHPLFNPKKEEHLFIILRLHKLKNQVGTQELAHATTNILERSISDITKTATTSLVENLKNQAERTIPHKREKHYSQEGFDLLDDSTQKIHNGITTKTQDNKTIIELPEMTDSQTNPIPKRNITTWPNDAEKRIMFSTSHADDYSLILLIEGALKAAKAMLPTTATFLIFIPPNNPEDTETVAKLCAMANFVGLRPQFQTKPGCEATAKIFDHQFKAEYGVPEAVHDNVLTLSNKRPDILQDLLDRIKPINTYTPPTSKKYLKKS